jgi:16S rRNA (cytidine1402-2'-O)-methyltransferase
MIRGGESPLPASLYIVATPIGHLNDMSMRAINVLHSVDLIAAEDTRHSARLLRHFDIWTPLISYHDHSETSDLDGMLKRLRAGEAIALISDAGTPLVSDPGYKLVVACHREQIPVVPIPGPSATITALSAAGLPTDHFYFEGFLPPKPGQRANRLKALTAIEGTLIFFESPRRLAVSLEAMHQVLGDREAALCRELTKAHETIYRAVLSELHEFVLSDANQQRGEVVILVHGFDPAMVTLTPETARLLARLADELPPRRAAAVVADITGLPARQLYQWLLDRRHDS